MGELATSLTSTQQCSVGCGMVVGELALGIIHLSSVDDLGVVAG